MPALSLNPTGLTWSRKLRAVLISCLLLFGAVAGCLSLLAAGQRPAQAAAVSHIGTNQAVLVICVRYNDVATTRRTCGDWATTLQTDVNAFYNRATFGRTTFTFTAAAGPTNGWYDLGAASTTYNYYTTGQSAVTLADANVNFANFNHVVVITNFTGFGAQGAMANWWTVADGIEATQVIGGVSVGRRLMTMSVTNEWVADGGFGFTPGYGAGAVDDGATVVGHEMGHQMGAPGHYGSVFWGTGTREVISPWSVMGFSPTLTHFLGWEKTHRNWTQSGFVTTVGPPSGTNINQLIRIKPIERTPNGADVQLIRVPLANSPSFIGYVVELRRQTNGDEQIPSAGVLVTYVDETPGVAFPMLVLDDPSAPGNGAESPLDLGETFTDAGYNLSISYESNAGPEDANVRVQYNLPTLPGPNPAITPWGAPPWETTDIWIDSQKNGWGTYLYVDGSGNPTGNADDAWVNHSNRVMVRVRNPGAATATNVRAQVFVNSPPGMGDAGANWDYLGTIVFPSIASGATATNFVNWTPSVGAHTCIKVVLLPTPNESSTSDNLAQENVASFDTSPGSPYAPVSLKVQVNNPFADKEVSVHYVLRDVPDGWGFLIEPTDAVLPPGGSEHVLVSIFPSGFGQRAERENYERLEALRRKTTQIGFLGRPKLEAQIPLADTFVPIGGVDMWTRLVNRTGLTCAVNGRRPVRPRPTWWGPATSPTLKMLQDSLPKRTERGAALPPTKGGPRVDSPGLAARAMLDSMALIRPEAEFIAVRPNGPLVVTGQLSPAVAGATIAVEIRAPNGRSDIVLVKADREGRYAARLKPFGRGEAMIRAYYAGDLRHGPSDSEQCRVVVR